MKNKNDNYLVTPLNVSHAVPVYDAHGRVTGYSVRVEYYMAKTFVYATQDGRKKAYDDAVQWVYSIQKSGYNLLRNPKYSIPQFSNILSTYVLCEYNKVFPNYPFVDFRNRAWRFWMKMQAECAKIDKRAVISTYENTK